MSNVTYNPEDMTITVAGVEDIERQLGDLKHKTPAAMKFAINATARKTRKLMLDRAKARYAVTAKGREHIDELAQKHPARNTDLMTELYIESRDIDLAYFEHSPTQVFSGRNVANAPSMVRGRVLKSSPMKELGGGSHNTAKAFLAEFVSGHVGMIRRQIGKKAKYDTTRKSGGKVPRWRNRDGIVENTETAYAPSGPAMHNTIWPEVEPTAEEILQEQLQRRVDMILARARKE